MAGWDFNGRGHLFYSRNLGLRQEFVGLFKIKL